MRHAGMLWLPRALQAALQHRLHPKLARLGFPDMGIGIERRRRRYRFQWDCHLQKCLNVQRSWLDAAADTVRAKHGRTTLLVLGAGRLYDLNVPVIRTLFRKAILVDADPLAVPRWDRLSGIEVEAHLIEMSGVLEKALELLCAMPRGLSWSRALGEIEALPERLFEGPELPQSSFVSCPADALISLNVLSQIPIVYQNTAEQVLVGRFPRAEVQAREGEWIQAVTPLCAALVRQHLRDLCRFAGPVLLISDVEYAHYQFPRRAGWDGCPMRLVESGTEAPRWSTAEDKPAPSWDITPALYGVNLLLSDWPQRENLDVQAELLDEWLWHIAPQERRLFPWSAATEGTINRVRAFALSRRFR